MLFSGDCTVGEDGLACKIFVEKKGNNGKLIYVGE